jgi:osmotically-inducible protein OsmY
VVVGVAAHWYFTRPESQATVADAKESVRNTAPKVEQSLKETFDTDKLKEELARSGRVIREKARKAGESLADSTANARTTAIIKGKLLSESNLAALKIDVDTTDGVVTLSGTVSSHEEIAKAMSLALETEGVHKVVSTLQVKSKDPSERQTKEISR